ncbi:hypothetical protein ABW20_dc0105881 [Dactylellina cionopaga]|nr:hypothetical protein ABW20_dc0105881 [Dactylellina cionopaga]
MTELELFDVDTLEFARQFTLIEFQDYIKIKPTEFLDTAWGKPSSSDSDPAENLKYVLLKNLQLYNWIVGAVLNQDDAEKQGAVIDKFISLAEVHRANIYTIVAMSIVKQLCDNSMHYFTLVSIINSST